MIFNSKEIYLDNAAATKPSDGVIFEIQKTLSKSYANASSIHRMGFESSKIIKKARENIAQMLGCKESEIYFTSGGTEANNLAILGTAARFKSKRANKIITTEFEHHSVLFPCKKLESDGFEVVFLKPDENGDISSDEILNAIDERTILVSMMMVNNEIGSCLSLQNVKNMIVQKRSKAIFHVDAAQSFCKIPTKVSKLKCDLLTTTAHKVHGPQGIGALFCSEKIKISPINFGGKQQNSLRPGTECTALISGFSKAVEEACDFENSFEKVRKLYEECKNSLLKINGIKMNIASNSFPYILNLSIPGVKNEVLLNFLSSNNIFISSSSACAKGNRSHVLKSIGLSRDRIDSAVRVSFSKNNTSEEIKRFIDVLEKGVDAIKNKETNNAMNCLN
ncbi:MAG: cysteine desulfurase [Oscillospiraceae bacterium]|nr:cysteine desulfurase [Oscillospiraceae bacterium]